MSAVAVVQNTRLLSTTHHLLATDQSNSKHDPGAQKQREQERVSQTNNEAQKKWPSFFTPETVGEPGEKPASSGDGGQVETPSQSSGGIWTSLRSRMEDTKETQETIGTAATASKEGGNDTNIPVDETSQSATPKPPAAAPKKGKKDNKTNKDTSSTRGGESSQSAPPKKPAAKSKRSKGKTPLNVKAIRPAKLKLRPVEGPSAQQTPPQLCYNLDRVLFNPGVYHMQDHRSGVFNFDPYLASIMPVEEFDFNTLKEYTTSSKDGKLRELCASHGLKYCGSTSSMTAILSHFHFLLSGWRPPTLDTLSKSLKPDSLNFTALSRGPAAAFAHFKDGVYAIDADKEYDTENILSMLGKSMEKLLTLPKEEFEKYSRSKSHELSEEEKNAEEAYHFTTLGDFMMRSQLDAHDPRLPGSGVFDLKTRAVVSIRMDVEGYKKGRGYEIRQRFGQWESFEREYYDMIRAAFLKYSLQVRMGRMDGIFVAFHNTQRIFGFQYISLAEMDYAIHGTPYPWLGDLEFKCSVSLLNDLLNRATKRFPGRTLRLHVETRPTKVPLTYFFVEPVTEEEMKRTQEASKPSVEQLEREIQNLSREEREAESQAESVADVEASSQGEAAKGEEPDKGADEAPTNDPQSQDAWDEMMAKVDDAVENESMGVRSIREAVQEALEHSGLLQDKTELESEKYLDDLVSALTAHSSKQPPTPNEEEAGAPGQPADGASDSDSTTLANLIVRVTEGINEKSPNLRPFERKVAELAKQVKKSESAPVDEAVATTEADVDADADTKTKTKTKPQDTASGEPKPELLGMYVSIRNRVNGEFVERPSGSERKMDWVVQYTITELPDGRAQSIYSQVKKRRKDVLEKNPRARSADWYRMHQGKLSMLSKRGVKYRAKRTQQEAGSPVYVAWDRDPLPPNNTENS